MRTFELQIITLTDETRLKLDNFAKRFNLALHHLYKEDCKVNNKLTKNQFKSEYQHDFNLNARHFNSVFDTMRGNTSSALECAKLHLENIRLKLYDIKKEIKRLETKQKKYLESSTSVKALKPAKKVAVFTTKDKSKLYRLKQKVPKLENTLIALMKQISENKPQLCFGSKKLFNEQFNNPEHDHAEWKQRWINARNSNFMLVGSKDESYGNVNAQLTYVEYNTDITPAVDDKKYNIEDLKLYQLRVNLKDSIEIINVCIPYGHYLKQAIINNAYAKNKDKQEIYNLLDIDIINIKINEFLEKYNL